MVKPQLAWGLLARIIAWLVVCVVVMWLLSMTLQTTRSLQSSASSLGRIRLSDPVRELNLQPFRNKVQPLRNLLQSQNATRRRAARTYLLVDVLGNVAVFVPFGLALAIATVPSRPKSPPHKGRRGRLWPWWLAVAAAGLLLSLFIEIAQLAIPSRVTDVDDVILNTLGTAAGAFVVWVAVRLLDRIWGSRAGMRPAPTKPAFTYGVSNDRSDRTS